MLKKINWFRFKYSFISKLRNKFTHIVHKRAQFETKWQRENKVRNFCAVSDFRKMMFTY